eukprot:6076867-Prymnesium_polylepis.1
MSYRHPNVHKIRAPPMRTRSAHARLSPQEHKAALVSLRGGNHPTSTSPRSNAASPRANAASASTSTQAAAAAGGAAA